MVDTDPTEHSEESTPPVVLCCAAADEKAARATADALVARGHEVELVVGVEAGHAELQAAADRLDSLGLYVLCRSASMRRSTIDKLRAVLRANGVPFGRTLTLAIESTRPTALEERIVSVLRRMVTGRPDKFGRRPTNNSFSTPAPASVPPLLGSGPDEDTKAEVLSAEVISEASTPKLPLGRPRPAKVPPASSVRAPVTRSASSQPPSKLDPTAPTTKDTGRNKSGVRSAPTIADRRGSSPTPDGAPTEAALIAPATIPISTTLPPTTDRPAAAADDADDAVDTVVDRAGDEAVAADEIAAWADSLVGEVPQPPEEAGAQTRSATVDQPFAAAAPDYDDVGDTQVGGHHPESLSPVRDGQTAKQPVRQPLFAVAQTGPQGASLPSVPISTTGGVPAAASPGHGELDGSDERDGPTSVGGKLARALSGSRGMKIVLGGAVLLIVAVVIGVLASRSDKDAVASAKPTDKATARPTHKVSSETADKAADQTNGDAGAAETADRGEEDADTSATGADDPAIADEEIVEIAADPVAEATDDGGPPSRGAPEAEHLQPPADPGPPPTDPVPAASADAPAVAKAIRDREVRALDLFVVAPEESDAMAHDAAVSYCAGMNIAGLSDWRMPKLGELNSVVSAGLTGKSVYWSDTLGDAFGDTRIIVNGKKKRMGAAGVGYDGARVLCIRDRR